MQNRIANPYRRIAGVDEVGRGPLAGPVVACAVVIERAAGAGDGADDPATIDALRSAGVTDSKKLTPRRRARLRRKLLDLAGNGRIDWALGWASVAEIDALNIHHATLLAMQRALRALEAAPDFIRVDGRFIPPDWQSRGEAVIGGDAEVLEIAAASILAKEARDRWMAELGQRWPGYGLERHAGYGTPQHLEALRRLGATPAHRQSFAPVRRVLAAQAC